MRVLLAADFYPPHIGGVELQVQALATELSRRGHNVQVVTLQQPGLPKRSKEAGVEIVRLPAAATVTSWFSGSPDRRYHPPAPDPMVAILLRRLIKQTRPDVIQVHGWIANSVALATVGLRVPVVLSVRDYGYSCATRSMLINGRECPGPELRRCTRHAVEWYGPVKGLAATFGIRASRWLIRRQVSIVHSVSHHVAEVMERDLLGGIDREIVTIPDIVLRSTPAKSDASALQEVIAQLPAVPFLLFVGALQPHKGLGPLLAAYSALAHPPPLVLIGTPWPDTPTTFPPGVTVIRNAPHAAVMAAWERALFGIAPSIWPDPLPGVVREGMIAGRPVIGSRIGGIVDLITDEEDGLLVPPGNPTALAQAMQRLLDDDALRTRLGEAARISAGRFDGPTITSRFEGLYQRLIAKAPDGRPGPAAGNALSRIHIAGGSGTGKTTLARQLSALLELPVFHLDDIAAAYPGDDATNDRSLRANQIAQSKRWISEGIHVGWTDSLLQHADVIVWLDDVGWRWSAGRVVTRFASTSIVETRRRGIRGLFRMRSYARHLRELMGAIGEVRRFPSGTNTSTGDAGSRMATAEHLSRYATKTIHCRRRGDREAAVQLILASQQASPYGTRTAAEPARREPTRRNSGNDLA